MAAQTFTTLHGTQLRVDQRPGEQEVEVSFQLEPGPPCVLHWGVRRPAQTEWEPPARPLWAEGTHLYGAKAVQTPFPPQGGERRIDLRVPHSAGYASLDFALFFPDQGQWDNNQGRNYQVRLSAAEPSPAALMRAFREQQGGQPARFERVFDLQGQGQLAVGVTHQGDRYQVTLMSNLGAALILHWGVARRFPSEWLLPPVALRPAGTVIWQNNAAQTPFALQEGVNRLRFEFAEPEAPLGIQCVLKTQTGGWIKARDANFYIPIHQPASPLPAPPPAGGLKDVADEIIQAETNRNSWTLMHRFNLCHDLLDRLGNDQKGLALLFVWLRFSALRQLTWQRHYNTKPSELSHAQERLTHKLTALYAQSPESRPLVRLMLTTVGRGGEGQRIRDEILNIMHRHHVKEVAGHFLEEWHQKLHNNTTPDDVAICEAYLEFLRSHGNHELFYQTLQKSGVTRERLEGFERPIRSAPDFLPHLREGLIHDFEQFLKVLKSVHAGTDLETAIHTASNSLDADMQALLHSIWQDRNNPQVPLVDLATRLTEARRRLSARSPQAPNAREILYLDLALEQFLRLAVERSFHLSLDKNQWIELIERSLFNLNLSAPDAELAACARHWARLGAQPRWGPDWSLRARAVLERVGRRLGQLIDQAYQLLQPQAEYLGQAVHVDSWTITLFSEEVVRGSSLGFVLSALLNRLEPLLRQGAHLGNWQIISRGHGWGQVELVDSLRAIQGKTFDTPRVIIADHVMGDEEIPEGVTAVIAPDVTDIVSHVAVRARNSHLLFAACYDAALLERLKSLRGRQLRLEVNSSGDVVIEETGEDQPSLPSVRRPILPLVKPPPFSVYAVGVDEFNPGLVGGKSRQQKSLRRQLPEWIHQPHSAALPFAVFEKVLALDRNKAVAEHHARLLDELDADYAPVLVQLREAVLRLSAPPELIASLRSAMAKAALPWPDDWERAWTCIKAVWASKWNERAFLSRKARGIPHEGLYMAVLVQEVVPAEYAFVIHTANPFTGNRDELYAEVVLGLGETLVGNYPGRALSFLSDKATGNLSLLAYPGKSLGLYGAGLIFRSDSNGEDLAGYAGAGLYDSLLLDPPRQVPLDYSAEPLVWEENFRNRLLGAIAQIGIELEQRCGSPQDIEGAYAKGQFYVVQCRPQVGLPVQNS